jgi:glycerol-3-phosphate dehydrogenase
MSPLPDGPVDLLVIGGGINGAGIARDAAGRGLKVVLAERDDLASATSSASTKLVHGGLRYLEHYEFRLVREALAEREVLLALAPHIVRPLTFVMPHVPALRPAWLIRAGLFLYDHLGGRRRLPASRGLDLDRDPAGRPLKPEITRGFAYADCWVDDARLVVLNALDAAARGATILTRTACVGARRDGGLWRATLADSSGTRREIAARAVVNATGPWVREVVTGTLGLPAANAVRLVKGSHIVTRRLFEGEQAYILQNDDRRVVFAIPYEDDFTLIGTTDLAVDASAAAAPAIDAAEIDYLCRAVSRYFRRAVAASDVVWTYSGVRPLYDDGRTDPSAVTRDYVLDLDRGGDGAAPALSVYGGKITTYRRLAEQVMATLAPFLPAAGASWTATRPLPGGELGTPDFASFLAELERRYPGLPARQLRALARRHGSRAIRLIGEARTPADLGIDFAGGLCAREAEWLIAEEWAREPDDILWRRTKCGLHMSAEERRRFAEWMAQR